MLLKPAMPNICKVGDDGVRCRKMVQFSGKMWPAPVVLLVALQYALLGYHDRRACVQGPGWPDHCVRL